MEHSFHLKDFRTTAPLLKELLLFQATEIEKLYSWLVKELQAMVDPFDLDVFTPHMQKHVAKQKSRNLVSFAPLVFSLFFLHVRMV